MRNHTVEIGDRNGTAFKLHISTPTTLGASVDYVQGNKKTYELRLTGYSGPALSVETAYVGDWRAVDKGIIRYNSGRVINARDGKSLTSGMIYLLNLDNTWGIQLWDYEDAISVNDSGEGIVAQPWVLSVQPGRVSWTLID